MNLLCNSQDIQEDFIIYMDIKSDQGDEGKFRETSRRGRIQTHLHTLTENIQTHLHTQNETYKHTHIEIY